MDLQRKKPRLLDLFCGAGGASMGYHRAGFHVVGVDLHPQPHYPFEFHQADAMTYPLDGFDVIHASPPCQAYTALQGRCKNADAHPKLIVDTRLRLQSANVPYVIENVVGAPLLNPITLCGSSFNLKLRRHRLFECSEVLSSLPCRHNEMTKDVVFTQQYNKNFTTWCVPVYGNGGQKANHLWNEAMGIDWMRQGELAQAIPPAYTQFVGEQLIRVIGRSDRGEPVSSPRSSADGWATSEQDAGRREITLFRTSDEQGATYYHYDHKETPWK